MGGYGSGRYAGKNKVQHCRSIDVNKLNKLGGLKAGFSGKLHWTEDGEEVASINFSTTVNRLTLKYKYRQNMSDWKDVEQSVPVMWSPCRYGGERAYFRCPGIVNGRHCQQHVVKLYAGGKYFLCRHCYNLAYASQSEVSHERLSRRANKIRMALGGEPGVYAWINKPKGMWQRTFDRQRAKIIAAEEQSLVEFSKTIPGILSREEMEMYFN